MLLQSGRLYAIIANNTKPIGSVLAILEKSEKDRVIMTKRFRPAKTNPDLRALVWTGKNHCKVISIPDNPEMELGMEIIVWNIGATS